MESIRQLLHQETPSMEVLIEAFEQIARNGDMAFIKFDGQRLEYRYTILINFALEKGREMIRTDTDDLKKGLLHVLKQYVQ
jgi:hypothetical protein